MGNAPDFSTIFAKRVASGFNPSGSWIRTRFAPNLRISCFILPSSKSKCFTQTHPKHYNTHRHAKRGRRCSRSLRFCCPFPILSRLMYRATESSFLLFSQSLKYKFLLYTCNKLLSRNNSICIYRYTVDANSN